MPIPVIWSDRKTPTGVGDKYGVISTVEIKREDAVCALLDDLCPADRGLVVMLRVYLDAGIKRHGGDRLLCVGATVFEPARYREFTKEWNEFLEGWHAPAFHATDFYNGADVFRRDNAQAKARFLLDVIDVPRMIGKHISRGFAMAVLVDEFSAELRKLNDTTRVDTPHSFAVGAVLVWMSEWAEQRNYTDGFSYIMEAGDTDEAAIADIVRQMRADPKIAANIKVNSFAVVKKGAARGIEASDFVAWQWNKYYADRRSQNESAAPRQDFQAFVDWTDERFEYVFLTGERVGQILRLGQKQDGK